MAIKTCPTNCTKSALTGIRTRVAPVTGVNPRPLDDQGVFSLNPLRGVSKIFSLSEGFYLLLVTKNLTKKTTTP